MKIGICYSVLIIALGMCVLLVVKRAIGVDQMQMMQVEAAAEELLASAVLIRAVKNLSSEPAATNSHE